MTLKTERRTQTRKRPLSLVYVELPPSNGGMMRDLSEHGFSLRAMMPLQQSEKVAFSFALDSSARIDGEAIVLRVDEGGHVAALEFAGLPAHARDQIRRCLGRFDEPLTPEAAQPIPSKRPSLTELRAQIRAPRPPSPAPPPAKSASPLLENATAPPEPETPPLPLAPAPEISPPPPIVATPARPEAPHAPVLPVVEDVQAPPPGPTESAPARPEPPLSPAAESPQQPPWPPQIRMESDETSSSSLPEVSLTPPSAVQLTFEQVEAPPLPALLKLSSVRPEPLPAEIPVEPVAQIAITEPVAEPPARIPVPLPQPEPPAAMETQFPEPAPAPPVAPRRVMPPALEPLSTLEGETDSDAPGWMNRFTVGRAIGIMIFLTFLAGSYVYHREVGQALIWLGHQIAGDESQEGSRTVRPEIPSGSHPTPVPTPSSGATKPPPPSVQQSSGSAEPKSANLPAASDRTLSPQLKGATSGSLVPLTQVTRPTAPAPHADNSTEAGQEEYLEALQILRSPSRTSEVPAAIQLLWAAVEKGNTGAEIDLAGLFRAGRGVAKNCDQTRILLSAATRKGSKEARKRLEAFLREGCGN
jgi:hypothetical protein